jgi:hypothetical protein
MFNGVKSCEKLQESALAEARRHQIEIRAKRTGKSTDSPPDSSI